MKKLLILLLCSLCRYLTSNMVLEWLEREHEEDNANAENHPPTMAALRDCGLLKYFHIPGMRAQVWLLEYLVRMWDPDQQVFNVGAHTLTIDIEDIYFLIGLSRCGSHVSLTGNRGWSKIEEDLKNLNNYCKWNVMCLKQQDQFGTHKLRITYAKYS